jgi:tetratricopeptide (TPR) repeat protein
MARPTLYRLVSGVAAILLSACSGAGPPRQELWHLHNLVAQIQKSVVTVAALDTKNHVLRIGSGFFIGRDGTLVTNDHVLEGAYQAAIKTADGEKYPIDKVIARNPLIDLIKVRVQIPREQIAPLELAKDEPAIADRVVVIGSPLGLEQTVSEGIISAVREHPTNGKIYQLTAPISPGSSGGPALNLNGQVIGVVSFQAASGQNLNFAVSVKALQMLTNESKELSIAEWTIEKAGDDPRLAVSLCHEGAKLSIEGKYEAALDYYQKATETNPKDPDTWRGLGSCYIGLEQPDQALEAFHQSIALAPDDAAGHFMLAMYYKALGQYQQEIPSLQRVIGIDPENVQARLELADVYGRLGQTDAQIDVYDRILKVKPDDVDTLHLLGQTVGRVGRYDQALDLLHKASALAPDDAGIYFDIGVTYKFKHLPEEELRAYTRAIRADPQMVPAHYNIGLLFLKQGNRKLALQQYAILKSLDAATAEHLFNRIYPQSVDQIRAPEFSQ